MDPPPSSRRTASAVTFSDRASSAAAASCERNMSGEGVSCRQPSMMFASMHASPQLATPDSLPTDAVVEPGRAEAGCRGRGTRLNQVAIILGKRMARPKEPMFPHSP